MKTAVIYWSGTGNTEAMAKAVAEGAGVEATNVADFAGNITDYEALAFGCPAMGDEQLEEVEFEPFFARVESGLAGRRVLLFGSYDWGTGDWMHAWEERVRADGGELIDEGYITNLDANETELGELRELGKKLANV
jgi:flavodoxin short chain